MSAKTHPLTFIDPVCGKPGFHIVGVPLPCDPIVASRFERLDGTTPNACDVFACMSCGRPFQLWPGDSPALLSPSNYVRRPDDEMTETDRLRTLSRGVTGN